jgi:iron(III) transport system ATP-binding protein
MAASGVGAPGRILSKRDAIGIDICEVMVEGFDAPWPCANPLMLQ